MNPIRPSSPLQLWLPLHPTKIDPNWYRDTGSTDHITSDLDRLALRDRYHGDEQVQVGNGAGLQILHIGHSSINTATRPLALRNILHVPDISKHLLSVHKFSRDNDVFFEFHPWHFSIKDRKSKTSLLEGRCESRLYPIKASDVAALKHALVSNTTSFTQWHARLGHPSSQVVQSILRLNNISCAKESQLPVCNACRVAKSHQLPFTSSVHRSSSPLELIFSDVWGPAPHSVGGFKYYISFIDDFSKFSWIYLMHDRTEASPSSPPTESLPHELPPEIPVAPTNASAQSDTSAPALTSSDTAQSDDRNTPTAEPPSADNSSAHQYGTRLQNNIRRPKVRTDGTVTYSVVKDSISEPTSHVTAMGHPLWRQGMHDEFQALLVGGDKLSPEDTTRYRSVVGAL
ncbi:Retrovirus-related Pol polyprotein from transposon RE1 [Sesamum alatum]|uniref:Retrovirus-related Pol polyprotein from transposon RE1 n=1 Tax=Sesamum alatum TaxID=300844 RepID=A0AAE1XNV4_9LAMI|nr:Retrovirus-related Pol polyprotein from transposon RE1 [Sesamum alatum]